LNQKWNFYLKIFEDDQVAHLSAYNLNFKSKN